MGKVWQGAACGSRSHPVLTSGKPYLVPYEKGNKGCGTRLMRLSAIGLLRLSAVAAFVCLGTAGALAQPDDRYPRATPAITYARPRA